VNQGESRQLKTNRDEREVQPEATEANKMFQGESRPIKMKIKVDQGGLRQIKVSKADHGSLIKVEKSGRALWLP
jgi:hypothetical protein